MSGASEAGRAAQALELRKAGVGYEQIAERLGFADSDEARAVVTALLADVLADDGRESAVLERLRIDQMLTGLYPKARSGDSKAIEQMLRLMERRRVLEEAGIENGAHGR